MWRGSPNKKMRERNAVLYSRHTDRGACTHSWTRHWLTTTDTPSPEHRRSSAAHTSVPLSTLAGFLLAVRAARSHASAPQPGRVLRQRGAPPHLQLRLPQTCSTKTPTCKCARWSISMLYRAVENSSSLERRTAGCVLFVTCYLLLPSWYHGLSDDQGTPSHAIGQKPAIVRRHTVNRLIHI